MNQSTIEAAIAQHKSFDRRDKGFISLNYADLRGLYLKDYFFHCADLRNANFEGTYLTGAFFKGADLRDANLQTATLRNANLKGADLRGANLCAADLRGANFEGVDLEGVDLEGVSLVDIKGIIQVGDLIGSTPPEGIHIHDGAWYGTPNELRKIVHEIWMQEGDEQMYGEYLHAIDLIEFTLKKYY